MSTAHSLPTDVSADLEEAVKHAMSLQRDREVMIAACERMDRMSEEIRKKYGLLDIGVPAIRELRGELPEP